jgi:hypothetical protein
MARCLYTIALTASLIGAFLLSAPSSQGATLPADFAPICARAGERVVSPPGPNVRLPEDPLLRAISTTSDPASLRAALGTSDPNAFRGKQGTTALTYAAGAGNWPAVQVLLTAGADANRPSKYGEVPLERAIAQMQTEIACQLIVHGAAVPLPSEPLFYLLPASTLTQRDADAVAFARLFLEAGYPVNARLPPADQTALHVAAETGKVELAKYLLSRRANTSLRDAQGRTPLEVAKTNGHQAIVKLLHTAKGR